VDFTGASQSNGFNNFGWEINNATGTPGPTGDPVSGWSLLAAGLQTGAFPLGPGNFNFTATPADKMTFALQTLINPTPAGTDNFGPMANFDPLGSFSWTVVHWDTAYAGPVDDATLTNSTIFLTGGSADFAPFANPIDPNHRFSWHLDQAAHNLNLVYSPVPEPGSVILTTAAGLGLGWVARRRKRAGK